MFPRECRSAAAPSVGSVSESHRDHRSREGDPMSEYLILIYEDEKGYADADEKLMNEVMEAHNRFAEQVAEHGATLVGGNGLQPTAAASRCGPSWTTPDDDPAVTADVPEDVEGAVADAHRREWGFVLAATVRVAGSIDLAEECVQDAYGAALDTWRRQGVPRSPGAWLTTTARRRALDVLRREQTLRRKLPLLAEPGVTAGADEAMADPEDEVITDERLRL